MAKYTKIKNISKYLPKQADNFITTGQLLAIEQAASFSHFN